MKTKSTPKADAIETKGKVLKTDIKKTGQTTRVKGHLSATAKRQQAKRDTRNP